MDVTQNKWANLAILFVLVVVAAVVALSLVEFRPKEGEASTLKPTLGFRNKAKKASGG